MSPATHHPDRNERLAELLRPLELDTPALRDLSEVFSRSIATCLATDHHSDRELPMLPSFITSRPDGRERGTYLALDLGGTNLRVCLVDLLGEGKWTLEQQSHVISTELKEGMGSDLFAWIARCIGTFLHSIGRDPSEDHPLPLGWTFSFPVDQPDLARGKLTMWNKGFVCKGVLGEDVVEFLQHALAEAKVHVQVVALLNDTVGALLAAGYQEPDTLIGAIIGTGTNAAYWEGSTLGSVEDSGNPIEDISGEGYMAINTEWGAFGRGKGSLPMTKWDKALDNGTENPGVQPFEKMISGRYLGELVRQVLHDVPECARLFAKEGGALREAWSFDTAHISRVLEDTSLEGTEIRAWLAKSTGPSAPLAEEVQALRQVCQIVARRAARLASIAMAAVIRRCCGDEGYHLSIGGDGSVFEHLPGFQEELLVGIVDILGQEASAIRILLAKDGSGVGAALAAAMAVKASILPLKAA